MATAFVDLQEARHLADYDLAEFFTKVQVTKHIADAEQASQALSRIRSSPHGEQLLWEMLLGRLER